MSRTGFAHLPLHGGRAPSWLFQRMVPLSREIVIFIATEFGRAEVLRRLSDPYWFQAFGCVLGFDWHSSGLTTTVCGTLKEGLRGTQNELGIYVAGGKDATSRKTPGEITTTCEHLGRDPQSLVFCCDETASAVRIFGLTSNAGARLCRRGMSRRAAGDSARAATSLQVFRSPTPRKPCARPRSRPPRGSASVNAAKIDRSEKVKAFKRLADFHSIACVGCASGAPRISAA